jgi:SAM-dependent methyltransferase
MPVYIKLLLFKEKWVVEHRMAAKKRAFVREDFENIFRKKQDPWSYDTAHQQHRIKLICQQIPGGASILEIGSAEGACTSFLAQKAVHVISIDISRAALERAKIHCRTARNVDFVQADLLHLPFRNMFDLILCAGVLVYFPETTLLDHAIHGMLQRLKPGGVLILENMWESSGGSRAGSTVHEMFLHQAGVQLIKLERHEEYGISVFKKRI